MTQSSQQKTTVQQQEKKSTKDRKDDKESILKKEKKNANYWDRIAEDPASGYKNEENDDPLLNVDQQPDDNKKGDQAV